MVQSEIQKIANSIEYENRRRELRKEFYEHGVRFYDKDGEGFILNGVKNYVNRYF